MNNFFLDTNIVIDILLSRKPFFETSVQLFHYAEKNKVKLCISALSYWNIYYVIKKVNSRQETISIIKNLNNYLTAVDVTQKIITQSINSLFSDFEDAIQYYSALTLGNVTAIVTRNHKDFKQSDIAVINPEQALALIL